MPAFAENPLRKAAAGEKTCLGFYIEIPAVEIVEIAALAGADFVRLDYCHGAWDLSKLQHCILAAERRGAVPMVRMTLSDQDIGRALEFGAMGVIVPDISTPELARAAVRAAKFAPLGKRGLFSASRQSGYGEMSGAKYIEWSNREIMLGIQIESAEALQNLDAILDVEGIDLVLSGRGDLSNALGVPGQKTHPSVLEAEEKIFSKALARGIAISPQLDCFSDGLTQEIRAWNQRGAHIISLGVDVAVIRKAFSCAVRRARPTE